MRTTIKVAIMMAIFAFAIHSCKEKEKLTLLSISVTSPTTKTSYEVGDKIDLSGMVVTAKFSDGSTETITIIEGMLEYDFSTAGSKTVTITYEYKGVTKKATFNVTVSEPKPDATLVSIAVTAQPTKKIYEIDDNFETAGMVVTATYSDETTAPVTVTAGMLTYDFESAGINKTVFIAYAEKGVIKTAIVTGITVNAPLSEEATLVSIAVTTPPMKKIYWVDDEFEPAGMVVTATYSIGTPAPVVVTDDMISYNFSTAGTKTVTITYEYKDVTKAATFTVTVNEPLAPEATLVSIAVTTQPTQKTYDVNEPFNIAGMVVTATYSDETTAPVAVTDDNLTYDFSAAGTNKTVMISYQYKEIIKTATVTGITVTAPAPKTVVLDDQAGTLRQFSGKGDFASSATFAVTTTSIANGKPAGTITWYTTAAGTVKGGAPDITTSAPAVVDNNATVTITAKLFRAASGRLGASGTEAGTYYFTVTYDGKESNVQTVTVNPPAAGTKSVSLDDQDGTLTQHTTTTTTSATFEVTTANIANGGEAGSITWYTTAAGTVEGGGPIIDISAPAVVSNKAIVTITTRRVMTLSGISVGTFAGIYYFTVTYDGVESNVQAVTVGPKSVTVTSAISPINQPRFNIATVAIADGATSTVTFTNPAGVNLSTQPNFVVSKTIVENNAASVTFSVAKAAQLLGTAPPAGTYYFRVKIDGVASAVSSFVWK